MNEREDPDNATIFGEKAWPLATFGNNMDPMGETSEGNAATMIPMMQIMNIRRMLFFMINHPRKNHWDLLYLADISA